MKECWFLHNSGMGDHIIYNGLVRELSKNYDKFNLFCSPHNLTNVRFMYRDDPKINIIQCSEDRAFEYWKSNGKGVFKSTLLRFNVPDEDYEKKWNKFKHFDQIPYFMEDIPFGCKYSSFYYKRDEEAEIKITGTYNLPGEMEYIFVHDESSLGIHEMKYSVNCHWFTIIKPRKNESIFDYRFIIKYAGQVHCCDSAFLNFINTFADECKGKLYFHKYAKFQCGSDFYTPTLNKAWNIVGR